MENKYLSVFQQSITEVFEEMGFGKLEVAQFDEKEYSYEVVSTVGLTGDIQGYVMFQTDMNSAKSFIREMVENMGMEIEEEKFGDFHREALGEITNQLSGRSAVLLEDAGYDCDITPPTIITGTNIYMDMINLQDSVSLLTTGGFGNFRFFVGIKKIAISD